MKALIITDGTKSIQSIALLIKKTLDIKTTIYSAQDFIGNEILSADIFFIGCEKPVPSSFAFLEKMLLHINLAPRKCGLFSVNQKSIKYLEGIIKDCEAKSQETLIIEKDTDSKAAVKKWLKTMKKNEQNQE
ncbi:MAG: hypothetical protein LBC80_04070 [Treponema sp.]|nr:hypothetical protein [Treponema sp.]